GSARSDRRSASPRVSAMARAPRPPRAAKRARPRARARAHASRFPSPPLALGFPRREPLRDRLLVSVLDRHVIFRAGDRVGQVLLVRDPAAVVRILIIL